MPYPHIYPSTSKKNVICKILLDKVHNTLKLRTRATGDKKTGYRFAAQAIKYNGAGDYINNFLS